MRTTLLDPEPQPIPEPGISHVTFYVPEESVYFPAHTAKEVEPGGTLVLADPGILGNLFVGFVKSSLQAVVKVEELNCDYEVLMHCDYEFNIEGHRNDLMNIVNQWNRDQRALEKDILDWHSVYVASKFGLGDELANEMI